MKKLLCPLLQSAIWLKARDGYFDRITDIFRLVFITCRIQNGNLVVYAINKQTNIIDVLNLFMIFIQLKHEDGLTIAKMDATANDVPKAYDVQGLVWLFDYATLTVKPA